ncbi:hypothetical protein FOA52_010963 [Chlamydomonas sp. UWO 241]|nr:hypothetical protein FOA52_010963 [Chlamydomonas sp. UWO 241]
MQNLQAAPVAPETSAADVGDLGLDVLSNPLLFSHLWGLLDRDGKRSIRGVSRRLVELFDAVVEALDLREEGMSEGDTSALALAKWTRITSLTADADEGSLRVICAAPLAKLCKLVLYAVRGLVS